MYGHADFKIKLSHVQFKKSEILYNLKCVSEGNYEQVSKKVKSGHLDDFLLAETFHLSSESLDQFRGLLGISRTSCKRRTISLTTDCQ